MERKYFTLKKEGNEITVLGKPIWANNIKEARKIATTTYIDVVTSGKAQLVVVGIKGLKQMIGF